MRNKITITYIKTHTLHEKDYNNGLEGCRCEAMIPFKDSMLDETSVELLLLLPVIRYTHHNLNKLKENP